MLVNDNNSTPTNIYISGYALPLSDSIKFLGVTIDSEVSLRQHILQQSKTSMWQLSEIRRIGSRLNRATTETIVRAFITSCLDYCNSLYSRLPDVATHPLTRVLNCAARTITLSRKYDHITLDLRELHWLPIKQRVQFKVACFVFQCLHGCAPVYLSNNIRLCDSARLSAARQLIVPTHTNNCFESFGPVIWNSLPTSLRSANLTLSAFIKQLKTVLFTVAYV